MNPVYILESYETLSATEARSQERRGGVLYRHTLLLLASLDLAACCETNGEFIFGDEVKPVFRPHSDMREHVEAVCAVYRSKNVRLNDWCEDNYLLIRERAAEENKTLSRVKGLCL